MNKIQVTNLSIYPIKSCRGIELNELQIVKTGPAFDRGWMVVDQNNQFITLRTHSKLAEIRSELSSENLKISFADYKFNISLSEGSKKIEKVTVWDDSFLAGIESDEINNSLSVFLNQKVKLVRYQNESFRDLKLAQSDVVKETMFSESRPVLIVNEKSFEMLNEKLVANNLDQSNLNRFRSNMIISGLDAYAEEKIKKIKIGEVEFINPKPCARCVIVNMDHDTGQVVLKETLKYLPLIQSEKGPRIILGVYLTPANLGVIRLNDSCQVEY